MKELLEQNFGKHYKSTKIVQVFSETKFGKFSFVDLRACSDCKIHKADCNHIVINVDSSDQVIEAIQLEAFLDNFTHLKSIQSGKKCDLMLVSEDKVVFCDMTCSMSKYINPYKMKDGQLKIGKRNTVKQQVANSITLLCDVPEINSEIIKKRNKIALFAYRIKDFDKCDIFDHKVGSNMTSFDIRYEVLSNEHMYSDISNGFLFTEIQYPEEYVW